MNPQIINLIITAIIFAFLIFGFLWGFARGLKKSAFRGVWLIITLLIALFITQPIAKAIIGINISSLNIQIDSKTATTISEAIQLYVTQAIGEDIISGIPALANLINTLPIMVASPIIFTVIFWILKIVLWPIWAIIAHIIFKQKTKKVVAEKTYVNINNKPVYVAGNNEEKKPNKHRWYGSLVGIVCGLIVCCATFVPVMGFLNICEEIDNMQITYKIEEPETDANLSSNTFVLTTTTDDASTENTTPSTQTMSMLEYLTKDAYPYISAVKGSAGIFTLKITGVKAISSAQFNYLSSSKVNGTQISLGEDVNTILGVGQDVINISNTDFNHLTKETLDGVLTASQRIINTFKDVRLISSIGTDSLNYFCDNVLNNPDFFVKLADITDEQLKAIAKSALEIGKDYTYSQLLDDAINLVEIVKISNNNNLVIPLINNEIKNDDLNSVKQYLSNIGNDFSKDISKSIFNINILNKMAYTLIDAGLEKATNLIGATYEKPVKCEDTSVYENYLSNIITNTLNIISSLSCDSKYYATASTFTNLGTLVNEIKSYKQIDGDLTKYHIITSTTFNNIIKKLEDNVKEETKKLNDEELLSILNPIIDNMSHINDFETEFELYGKAYELLLPYVEDIDNKITKEELSKMSLENLGASINNLNETKLIDNNFYKLYNYFIKNYIAKTKINETSLSSLASKLLIEETNNKVDYKLQLKNANELFSQVILLTDNLTAENITDSSTLKLLGTNLQLIKERNVTIPSTQAILFKIDDIVAEFLKIGSSLTDNTDVKEVMLNLQTEIENTEDKSTINYKTEFTHIANVKDMLDSETIELKNIVNTLDVIVNGNDQISASTLLPKALFNVLLNYLPASNGYNNNIKNVLDNANTNATKIKNGEITVTNYASELNALIKLVRIIDNVNNIDIEDTNIDATIQTLSNDIEFITNNTSLFTNLKAETINLVFDEIINNLDSTEDADLIEVLKQSKEDVKTNAFASLKQIYDDINSIKDNFSNLDYNESELENESTINQLNNSLKEIANSVSFSYKTSNSIITAILKNINATIQSINSNEYPLIATQLETYKTSFDTFISAKLLQLPTNNIQVNNDEYKNILTEVKNNLLLKPTI